MTFKVEVEDNDEGIHWPHDLVDRFLYVIDERPARGEAEATVKEVHLEGARKYHKTRYVKR